METLAEQPACAEVVSGMTRKEQLVELLNISFEDQHKKRGILTAKHTADHLTADGVTVQKWIPVTERLPEEMKSVLTCDHKGNIHIMRHYRGFKDPFGIDKNDMHFFPVTHWMPLPEPPKEG